jgi:hypothetical protein
VDPTSLRQDSSSRLKMADLQPTDVEATIAGAGLARSVQCSKITRKSMWQSLWRNPKVLLIAFFAS